MENDWNVPAKKLTHYHKTGIFLEKAIHDALNILKIKHYHNPFDERFSSKEGQGVDISIPQKRVDIEAKNNNGKYGFSPNWSEDEILKRFKPSKTRLHIVVCAFNRFSRKFLGFLKSKGIHVIEVGFQISKSTFNKGVQVLSEKLKWLTIIFDLPVNCSSKLSDHPTYNNIPMSNILERDKGRIVSFDVSYGLVSDSVSSFSVKDSVLDDKPKINVDRAEVKEKESVYSGRVKNKESDFRKEDFVEVTEKQSYETKIGVLGCVAVPYEAKLKVLGYRKYPVKETVKVVSD